MYIIIIFMFSFTIAIYAIISKIDKGNELYRIIINKNTIITHSINMLNSSENYNKKHSKVFSFHIYFFNVNQMIASKLI